MMIRDTLRYVVVSIALSGVLMSGQVSANGVVSQPIPSPHDALPIPLSQNDSLDGADSGRYQNLIEEAGPVGVEPIAASISNPRAADRIPSPLLAPVVDPSVEELDNLQSMRLMQESQRNASLAARLQGEPRKMLLERNDQIAAQLLRSAQIKEVAQRKADLYLEVSEIKPAEIVSQQTLKVDWSEVGFIEQLLGTWFFDKQYPAEVTAPLRRFFQEVRLVDRTGRTEPKLVKTDEISVMVNGQVLPVIFQENMGSAAFAWTQDHGVNLLSISMVDPLLPGMDLHYEKRAFAAPTAQALYDLAVKEGQLSNGQWGIVYGVSAAILSAFLLTAIFSARLMMDGLKYRKMMKGKRKQLSHERAKSNEPGQAKPVTRRAVASQENSVSPAVEAAA